METLEALGPFADRLDEWSLLLPLFGGSMLELGAKYNTGRSMSYKAFFTHLGLGIRHVSVDLNGAHGALRKDLCVPLELGTFDMVTNFGTTEHVENQDACWRNILEAMHVGSVLCSTTPAPGNWPWHGRYYPSALFFRELAGRNGLKIERLFECGTPPRVMIFARLMRETAREKCAVPAGSIPTEYLVVNKAGGYVGMAKE